MSQLLPAQDDKIVVKNLSIKDLLTNHGKDTEIISKQRRWWLFASSIVIVSIVGVIAGWEIVGDLESKAVWWVVASLMMLVSANWWYWTMSMLRKLINQQQSEVAIIANLAADIQEIRKDVTLIKEMTNIGLDKYK
jgi:hypothetical protein